MIYLDHNATTPVKPEILEVMLPFLSGNYCNASTAYSGGRSARKAIENARRITASCLNADPSEITFTSGGTEAGNMAVRGTAKALSDRGRHIISSSIEHPCILSTLRDLEKDGFDVTYLPVDSDGLVNPDDVERHITKETILITVMHANNETGVIEPIEDIGRIASRSNICFHTDAVQSAGKIPLDVRSLNADLVSISAHKFYGPKGTGVLFKKSGTPITPLMTGGLQEKGLRPGTENVAGIAGCAAALERACSLMGSETERLSRLRNRLEELVTSTIPETYIYSKNVSRVPNTSNISFASVDGESILLHLELKGICASSGSAWTTGEPSHVLSAMGTEPRHAQGSLRFSLGSSTEEPDIELTASVLASAVSKLRTISSL